CCATSGPWAARSPCRGGARRASAPFSRRSATLCPDRFGVIQMRIGSGFDVHAFTEGDHVMLGGVRVASDRGVAAHADGDVLLHALCDALLGALALGD